MGHEIVDQLTGFTAAILEMPQKSKHFLAMLDNNDYSSYYSAVVSKSGRVTLEAKHMRYLYTEIYESLNGFNSINLITSGL